MTLGPTAAALERYLDLLAARQRITASNIANAETPGYRAREVDFQAELRSYLAAPREAFLPIAVRESTGLPVKNDGNNVRLDAEMQALGDNVVRFQLASLLLQKQIRGLRNTIREGRG